MRVYQFRHIRLPDREDSAPGRGVTKEDRRSEALLASVQLRRSGPWGAFASLVTAETRRYRPGD